MKIRDYPDVLESFFIKLKKDLQSSTQTSSLDFAPKSTLVTADTIHDSRHITEVLFKLFFEHLSNDTNAHQSGVLIQILAH